MLVLLDFENYYKKIKILILFHIHNATQKYVKELRKRIRYQKYFLYFLLNLINKIFL